MNKVLCAAAVTAVSMSAMAEVKLIAAASVDATLEDLAIQTAGALESGVAGNPLGGIGSGLAYAGHHQFIALPDRGPNANSYDSSVDDTTSYIPRFHTFQMTLAKSLPGASLPFTLSPHLIKTTLLSSREPLVYGAAQPALNQHKHTHYFSGRSDNFSADLPSTHRRHARLDPEGVRVSADGRFVFISDEYGPFIHQFNRKSGERVRSIKLPAKFAASQLSAKGDTEISGNTVGRVANKGMEGLAISPDGSRLFGVMQSPLLQDGGTNAAYTRIVRVDLASGNTVEYAYPLDNVGSASKPKYLSISEIVAINNDEFLLLERDGKGLGDNNAAVNKKVYKVSLGAATDVSAMVGAAQLAPNALQKTLFLDLVSVLTAQGIAASEIPAKMEGLTFGPSVNVDGVNKATLFVSNDNDFLPFITDSLHPTPVANDNRIWVFSFDQADLPGYVAQQFHRDCYKD
jgi:hypothetical protein